MSEFTSPKLPGHLVRLSHEVADLGGVVLVVGGFVRDAHLGIRSADIDVEVFGVPGDECRRLLRRHGRIHDVGRAFPILKWTVRGMVHDVKLHDAALDLVANASERDLTINALYLDPRDGTILDPTGGRADLRGRLLRRVGSSFGQDSLRKLRLARFAWRTGFEIEPETLSVARALRLAGVARERVFEEVRRTLLADASVRVVPELWERVGMVSDWPELEGLFTRVGVHEIGLRLERARLAAAELPDPLRFVLLCLTEGLEPVQRERWVARILDETGTKLFAREIDDLPRLLGCLAADAERVDPVELTLLVRAGRAQVALSRGLVVSPSDPALQRIRDAIEELGLANGAPPPWLTGRDLLAAGWRPGPGLGQALECAYRYQIEGRFLSIEEARAWARASCDDEQRDVDNP
ncbi:MAG: CCA tRNA nucleotidyltransferase [Planctomycetes bacterium]|nr:CCA tRNA nucleotidyltransferase [Planctomycetota bacterium]